MKTSWTTLVVAALVAVGQVHAETSLVTPALRSVENASPTPHEERASIEKVNCGTMGPRPPGCLGPRPAVAPDANTPVAATEGARIDCDRFPSLPICDRAMPDTPVAATEERASVQLIDCRKFPNAPGCYAKPRPIDGGDNTVMDERALNPICNKFPRPPICGGPRPPIAPDTPVAAAEGV